MKPIQKILCPVDFSESSAKALQYASRFAAKLGAGLRVFHSVLGKSETEIGNTSANLQEFITANSVPGLQSKLACELGDPADSILRFGQAENVDMIVLHTNQESLKDRFLLGSITRKVLQKSAVPVLVMNGKSDPELSGAELQIRNILCPVDPEQSPTNVKDFAVYLTASFQAELVIFYSIPPLVDLPMNEVLDKLKQLPGDTTDRIGYRVEIGTTKQSILDAAKQLNSDLIVIGHHTERPLGEAFFSGTTHGIISDAPCPVIAVRI